MNRVLDVDGKDFFLDHGVTPPLRPRPAGIPVNASFVRFGRFLACLNQLHVHVGHKVSQFTILFGHHY